jgi:hypothetical protein
MTEMELQVELWRDRGQTSALMMPNYQPKGWWECDVMAVSKAGVWSEFEIKVSMSDFRQDAKKSKRKNWRDLELKHELLASRSERGPSYFWYLVPKSIAEQVAKELPEWAGLLCCEFVEWETWDGRKAGRYFIQAEVKAPRLHLKKIDQKVADHARGVCYWRLWSAKQSLAKERKRL